MTRRRDLLVGAACLIAAGAAQALRPRRHVSLLGRDSLAKIVPAAFGDWASHEVSDLVAPKTEGTLSAQLYNQTVERVYRNAATGVEVMALIAHGDTQSDALQLHRPEICYPAFGFAISQNRPIQLPLSDRAAIPARRLLADGPGRRENIIYWSRLGSFLPIDAGQQRADRLKTAMAGYVADGLLARFSIASTSRDDDSNAAFGALESFIPLLVKATATTKRQVLIGVELARALG